MLAKNVMTTRVVTVLEDTPIDDVVRTLLRHRISAVPVVDGTDKMVGIVSEGDLVRRAGAEDERHAWWLAGLVEPEARAQRYAKVRGLLAKDVMTTPVVTAGEDETLAHLATLLEEKRIKRVPIVRKGKLVGIVSRANLLHGIAAVPVSDVTAPADTTPPQARQSRATDETIRATILNTLHNEIGLGQGINVIVRGGVVDLWGGVETEAQRQAARAAAENAEGVATVSDHLTVLPPALRRLLGADRTTR